MSETPAAVIVDFLGIENKSTNPATPGAKTAESPLNLENICPAGAGSFDRATLKGLHAMHQIPMEGANAHAEFGAGSKLYSSCSADRGKGVSMPNMCTPDDLNLSLLPGRECKMTHIPLGGVPAPSAWSNLRWQTAPIRQRESTAQLTIFYGGMVNVYDHVPAHKAKAIMLLASGGNSVINANAANFGEPPLSITSKTEEALRAVDDNMQLLAGPHNGVPRNQSLRAGLPIIRKHSLQRFLEKRKERLESKAPYDCSVLHNSPEASPLSIPARP